MRLFPILAAIFVCILIYIVIFFRGGDDDVAQTDAATDGKTQQPIGVIAIKSEAREIDSAVIVRGQTEASRSVELRAETSGLVISEPLAKGPYIEAGQLLCELDPATRSSSLAEAEARLSEARMNHDASTALVDDGFASETRVAQTQAALDAAKAAVASAQKEIDRLSITAPFAGLLETKTAELGSLLQPGALCATVLQLDPMNLVGFVPETEVSRVSLGALAGARTASGEAITGEVSFISRAADPTTRTFRVEVKVPNKDQVLRDGQTAEIVIRAEGRKGHLVPQSALTLNDEGDLGVRVVNADSMAEFYKVSLLRDSPEGVWITGLEDSADVIIIGKEYVTNDVPVAPSYQELTQ